MDQSLLLLLSLLGCCAGQGLLPPPGQLYAVLATNVNFSTLVNTPSYAFISWTFNDGVNKPLNVLTVSPSTLKVNPLYQGRVQVNNTNGFLTLMALTPADTGDYTITLISSDGSTSTDDVKLQVLSPVSNVVIQSSLPEAIETNSTVVLNCSAKGSLLTFTWTNGTTPITADGARITLQTDSVSSALKITGVLRTDLVGPIYCTAANTLQTAQSAAFNLTVFYGPDPVTLRPPKLNPQFIRSDSNFSLSCSAVSSPPATFAWFHSQQPLGVTDPVLTLKAIRDMGLGTQLDNYTCVASNAKTLRSVSSPAVTFVVLDPISGVTITGPTAALIAGNSSANLSCQAAVGAAETASWLKDGKPLTPSARVAFSADTSSLLINPLQKEDNGEYRCHLQNPVSREGASYRMVVNYGPEPATVTGVKKVEENDPVTLTCSALSVPPANYTWKFNGTVTSVKTEQYSIQQPSLSNSGIYTCEAYNSVTGKTATYSHTLEVKAPGTLDAGLSDGAIAGIVIAVLIAIGASIALAMYCRQKVPIESPY